VVAYAEADLGIVRPFAGLIYGTADGDPTDKKLHGFAPASWRDVTQITGTSWFSHLEKSSAFAARDYACPARIGATPVGPAPAGAPPRTAQNIGTAALGSAAGGAECNHSEANPFNQRLGASSHLGIVSTYSNPGTLVIPAGVKVFPLKGHEITGWYVYRRMMDTTLLEVAFAPELAGRTIGKTLYHEVGGYWMWTLNPYFDIRLTGSIGIPGGATKDIARLADCNATAGGVQSCDGDDLALKGEVRFRARF